MREGERERREKEKRRERGVGRGERERDRQTEAAVFYNLILKVAYHPGTMWEMTIQCNTRRWEPSWRLSTI